jgi:hypothetical protein
LGTIIEMSANAVKVMGVKRLDINVDGVI